MNKDVEQKRKHVIQMSEAEVKLLVSHLKQIKKNVIRFSPHALERLAMYNLNQEIILKELYKCNLIEYNTKETYDGLSKRVLIRSRKPFRGKALVICVCLSTKQIITNYTCDFYDGHGTLNWKIYDENLQIAI